MIAFGRGCIATVLQADCGVVVSRDEDFKAVALQQIEIWLRNRDTLGTAAEAARNRFIHLQREAMAELSSFLAALGADKGMRTHDLGGVNTTTRCPTMNCRE